MVTFRMMENGERYIVYWYFPDGDESSGHGIIVLDKENNTITINEMAAEDFSHEISVKEQNELRDSVNEMKKEGNEPELTEEEWPIATEPITSTFFADHACSKIWGAYKKGEVMEEGMATWY